MLQTGAARKENTIDRGQMLPHQWGSRGAEGCLQGKRNIDVLVQPCPCSLQLPFDHQTTFSPPMSSPTHSLYPLGGTGRAAPVLIFLQTLCPLLITVGAVSISLSHPWILHGEEVERLVVLGGLECTWAELMGFAFLPLHPPCERGAS